LHWPLSLLLHDHGARSDDTAVAYIADAQLHQITGSQFAVDRKIEQGKLTRSFSDLEANSNRPDILQLQGHLLPNEFSFIPGCMLLRSVNGLLHDGLPTL
jgi:hypothetical protein